MVVICSMSELANGWCIFYVYKMFVFNPNSRLPKTFLIEEERIISEGQTFVEIIKRILYKSFTQEFDIQKIKNFVIINEYRICLYSIFDFYIYYSHEYEIILKKAMKIFNEIFLKVSERDIEFSIKNLYDCFVTNQFKITIIKDLLKIFSFDLSPRGCLRLSSDVKNPYKF